MRIVASGCFGAPQTGRAGRRRLLPVLLLLLAGVGAWPCAAQNAPADTARYRVQLPAAQVEGAQLIVFPPPDHRPPHRFTTYLELDALRSLGAGASLGAVLAQRTPLVVRQYGPGQLASLSVRGMAAQHVAVVWQGFTINFPTLGQADLSLLPTAALTSATLRHGPDAARVGSGAMGGALTLTTSGHGLPLLDVTTSIGSFGQQAVAVRASGGIRNSLFSTSAQIGRTTNDFPYTFRTFRGLRTAYQTNAASRSYSVTHDHTITLDRHGKWVATAAAWLTAANRQIPPALNTAPTHATQQDASQRLVVGVRFRTFTTLRVASLTDGLDYTDDLNGTSRSRSQSWQAQLEHQQPLRYGLRARLGAEGQLFRARVDGYGPGLYTERRAAALGELSWSELHRARGRAMLTVRQAVVPGHWVPLLPAASASWQFTTAILTEARNGRPVILTVEPHTGAARAFRATTLNERYWRPGGNPDLRPEMSTSYSAGVLVAVGGWDTSRKIRLNLDAFDQRVAEWVQWTPDAVTGVWSPRNLRRVRSRGIEGSLELEPRAFRRRLETTLHLAGQVLQTQKTVGAPTDPDPVGVQLPLVPVRSGSATLTQHYLLRRYPLRLRADLTSTAGSWRFTNGSGTEQLPAYGLLNAGIGGEWRFCEPPDAERRRRATLLSVRFDGFNLLNTTYQSQPNRPMPGHSWQLTLRVARSRDFDDCAR